MLPREQARYLGYEHKVTIVRENKNCGQWSTLFASLPTKLENKSSQHRVRWIRKLSRRQSSVGSHAAGDKGHFEPRSQVL